MAGPTEDAGSSARDRHLGLKTVTHRDGLLPNSYAFKLDLQILIK